MALKKKGEESPEDAWRGLLRDKSKSPPPKSEPGNNLAAQIREITAFPTGPPKPSFLGSQPSDAHSKMVEGIKKSMFEKIEGQISGARENFKKNFIRDIGNTYERLGHSTDLLMMVSGLIDDEELLGRGSSIDDRLRMLDAGIRLLGDEKNAARLRENYGEHPHTLYHIMKHVIELDAASLRLGEKSWFGSKYIEFALGDPEKFRKFVLPPNQASTYGARISDYARMSTEMISGEDRVPRDERTLLLARDVGVDGLKQLLEWEKKLETEKYTIIPDLEHGLRTFTNDHDFHLDDETKALIREIRGDPPRVYTRLFLESE